MKYEKAKVTIINLGNEDILTCSGYTACNNWPQQPSCTGWNMPKTQTKHKSYGWGWFGWFRWWF